MFAPKFACPFGTLLIVTGLAEATLKTQGEECFHLEACFPEENGCSEIVSEAILRLTAEPNEVGYGRLVREGERTAMSKVWECMCIVRIMQHVFSIQSGVQPE